MKRFLTGCAIGAFIGLSAVAGDAAAVDRCTNIVAMREQLWDLYGENVHGFGIDEQGWLTEIYVNVDTGTWSVVVTVPGRPTCIIRTGTGWDGVIREPVPGVMDGEPS